MEYTEEEIYDKESEELLEIAKGYPYVMAILSPVDGDWNNQHVNLRVGGGVANLETARTLLQKALDAIDAVDNND